MQVEAFKVGIERGEFPEFVYKYFRVNNHFTDSVRNGYLWHSVSSEFNDPYDGNVKIDFDGSRSEVKKFLKFTGLVKSRDERRTLSRLIEKGTKEKIRSILNESIEYVINQFGLVCFSEVNDNLLMWAHYANCHQGVCVKYETVKVMKDGWYPMPIAYADEYPTLNYATHPDPMVLARTVSGTKSKDWRYEKEFRFISNSPKKVTLNKDAIKEVIFGCRCPDQGTVKALFENNGYSVKYFDAVLKQGFFGLDINPTIT